MGNLFGGQPQSNIQTVTPPNPANVPLQDALTGLSQRQLGAAAPDSYWGAGYQMLPNSPMGQVYMPGANPTVFGQPYNQQNFPYFGGASNQMSAGYGGTAQQSGQGSGQATGGGSSPSPTAQQGSGQGGAPSGAQQPPPPQQQAQQAQNYQQGNPMAMGGYQPPPLLSALLQPGVLSNLMSAYGHALGGGGGMGNMMPQGPPQGQQPPMMTPYSQAQAPAAPPQQTMPPNVGSAGNPAGGSIGVK